MRIQINEKARFLLTEDARYKVLHGGRGSTKSWSVVDSLIVKATQQKHFIGCFRQYQKSIKDSAKQLIDNRIHQLGVGNEFTSTRDEIRHRGTGTKMVFHGLWHEPEKIKSMEGLTIGWVEEAHTTAQEGLDILKPTIRVEGSEIWFTFNRKNESDPVDKMFLGDDPPPNAIIQQLNYYDNPWLTDVLKEEMEWDKSHDHDKYQHIWLGMPLTHSEARIFKNYEINGDIEPAEGEALYYGADWGFSNDPSVLLRCWVDDAKRIIFVDQEAYKIGVEIDDLCDFWDQVEGSREYKVRADNARPETISHMNRHGFKVKGVKKGAGSIEEGVEFLKSYKIVVHPRCVHTIDELGLYCYKTDKRTGDILPVIEDKNNHCIDSLRYALEDIAFNRNQIHIG